MANLDLQSVDNFVFFFTIVLHKSCDGWILESDTRSTFKIIMKLFMFLCILKCILKLN